MSEKIVIRQDTESGFMIVHKNGKDEKFFGGFYNEVECPGTEDESFSCGLERWVDRPEDGATMFDTLQEAKDFLAVIQESCCKIVLYGQGDIENFMLGSYWYPLKEWNNIY